MKDFLKYFAATLLALAVVIISFIFIAGAVFNNRKPVMVPKQAVLVINLARPISDKPVSRTLNDVLEAGAGASVPASVPLKAILDGLEQAAMDNRITALYLRGQINAISGYSGWATVNEVRNAITKFKESKKTVIAFQENLDEKTYFLTSVADKSYFQPLGMFEMNGLASTLLFYTPLLNRFGIHVQAIKQGKYKSAVEPYTQDTISAENQEQLNVLLQDIFGTYLATVSQSKNIKENVLNDLVRTQGYLLPDDAVKAGLVDGLRNEPAVINELRGFTGEPEPEIGDDYFKNSVEISDYYQTFQRNRALAKDKIAVIYAEGTIVEGTNPGEAAAGYLVGLLRKARYDKNVKAVVLRINSPGGSAAASDKIYNETLLLKASKPFVTSMGSTAASGGYMIAMGGQRLFASANTITGSIGVFTLIPDISGLLRQVDINTSVVKTHPLADELSVLHPLSDKGRVQMQSYISLLYASFINDVASGRNLPVATVQELAQGRVWSGQRATQLGLVGESGGLSEAIQAAAALAGLTKYSVIEYQQAQGVTELLAGLLQQQSAGHISALQTTGPASLQKGMEWIEKQLNELKNYNDPHGIYARLPYDLIIE